MRLFVALCLPTEALHALETLQDRLPAGRPVPADNLHLTLAFLGEVDDTAAEALHDALSNLRAAPVMLRLGGAEVFGGRHGQAIALGAEGCPPLQDLHDRVRSRIHGAGLNTERRRFRPHVTLARLPGRGHAAPLVQALSTARLGPFACTGFALIESRLHPRGAIHTPLARYPLG